MMEADICATGPRPDLLRIGHRLRIWAGLHRPGVDLDNLQKTSTRRAFAA